mgnify:CR=1 FL=1
MQEDTKTKDYKFFPQNVLERTKSKWFKSEQKRKNKGKHFTKNNSNMNMSNRCSPLFVRPSNVITFPVDTSNHLHPATFPKQLPEWFIKLMSEEDDVILDPFVGSGTTGVVAKEYGRNFIGIDINKEYIELTGKRLEGVGVQLSIDYSSLN